ncbi:MAG: hypothetical protein JNN20_11085 [Betaproteobacteria bacterium]|nr:hypothetical protein [Betaproteobacteria bacterium]
MKRLDMMPRPDWPQKMEERKRFFSSGPACGLNLLRKLACTERKARDQHHD